MSKALLKVIMNLLATIMQLVTAPIGAALNATLPDLSAKVTEIVSVIVNFISGLAWVVDIIPPSVRVFLVFVLTLEIARNTIFQSTHALIKLYNLFQKIKFW